MGYSRLRSADELVLCPSLFFGRSKDECECLLVGYGATVTADDLWGWRFESVFFCLVEAYEF